MQTTVNLPNSIYRESEALAASRGSTVEEFIIEALKRVVQGDSVGDCEVELPVIRSRRPGTLDMLNFDLMTYLPDVNVWTALAAE